jgi:hypothetical protein
MLIADDSFVFAKFNLMQGWPDGHGLFAYGFSSRMYTEVTYNVVTVFGGKTCISFFFLFPWPVEMINKFSRGPTVSNRGFNLVTVLALGDGN